MLAEGKFFPTRTGKERDKSTLTAPSILHCLQKSPFKTAGEKLGYQYSFIKRYTRSATNGSDIVRNILK